MKISTTAIVIWLALTVFSVSASAQYTPTSTQVEDESARSLSGTWAQKVVNSSVSRVPIVGQVRTDSIGYLRLEIEQDDEELIITSEVCDLRVDTSVTKVRTVVPDRFAEALEPQTRRARVKERNGQYVFYAPKTFSTVGVRLRNEEHETLPTDSDDPRVLDQDKDGHPGMTLRIEGMISGELYVIQRSWDIQRGTVRDSTYIDGLIEWGNDQVLLGSSSVFLRNQPPSKPHPDAKRSYFRTTRIDDDASCSDIVAAKQSLFSRP